MTRYKWNLHWSAAVVLILAISFGCWGLAGGCSIPVAEDGCEPETFTALEQIRQISAELGQPMSLVAVAWVLQQPGVTAAIVGARKPEQIRQMAAAAELQFDSATLQKLNQATDSVKRILGPNPDMWDSQSRFR